MNNWSAKVRSSFCCHSGRKAAQTMQQVQFVADPVTASFSNSNNRERSTLLRTLPTESLYNIMIFLIVSITFTALTMPVAMFQASMGLGSPYAAIVTSV
jgi:hypothetical protein